MLIAYEKATDSIKKDYKTYEVIVEEVPGGWNITKNGKRLEFRVDQLEFVPDMVNIFEGYHELFLVWSSGNSCDKSGFFSAIFRNRGFDLTHIGSIFIDANNNSHLFTRFPITEVGNTKATLIKHDPSLGTRSEDAFLRTLPPEAEFEAWNQRHRSKINFLGDISTNDSLTMIESQLDLLTKIVLSFAPESLEKNALKDATENNTVFSLHNLDKITQTIYRQKNYIRDKQRDYFNTRGKAKNADLSS